MKHDGSTIDTPSRISHSFLCIFSRLMYTVKLKYYTIGAKTLEQVLQQLFYDWRRHESHSAVQGVTGETLAALHLQLSTKRKNTDFRQWILNGWPYSAPSKWLVSRRVKSDHMHYLLPVV